MSVGEIESVRVCARMLYIYTYIYIYIDIYKHILHTHTQIHVHAHRLTAVQTRTRYGVATISRLLKMIGLFCRISSLSRALLQKRPMNLRSQLIVATPYVIGIGWR